MTFDSTCSGTCWGCADSCWASLWMRNTQTRQLFKKMLSGSQITAAPLIQLCFKLLQIRKESSPPFQRKKQQQPNQDFSNFSSEALNNTNETTRAFRFNRSLWGFHVLSRLLPSQFLTASPGRMCSSSFSAPAQFSTLSNAKCNFVDSSIQRF